MEVEKALETFSLDNLPSAWAEKVWPLVQENAQPPYYLIGGGITRTLINMISGSNLEITNYDLAVGSLAKNPNLKEGWQLNRNTFGNWKVVSTSVGIDVDVWRFAEWKRASRRVASLEQAVTAVPINIQAVGFDILEEKLYYDSAFALCLKERCIKTLSEEEHEYRCKIYKVSREEDLIAQAKKFGFRYEL